MVGRSGDSKQTIFYGWPWSSGFHIFAKNIDCGYTLEPSQ